MKMTMSWNVRYAILFILFCIIVHGLMTGVTNLLFTQAKDNKDEKPSETVEVNQLNKQLKSKIVTEREKAAEELGKLGSKAETAIPNLIKMLGDEEGMSGVEAFQALKKIGQMSVDPLITELQNRENQRHLFMVIGVLGDIEDHRAVEPIIPFLNDNDPEIRWAASLALWDMPDQRAFESLLKALKDESSKVRENAAAALGRIRDTRAAEPLLELFRNESDNDVKIHAAIALGRLKSAAASEALIKSITNSDVNNSALVFLVDALGEIGNRIAVAPLRNILLNKTNDRRTRTSAAYALGKLLPDADTIDVLVQVWKNPDEVFEVRTAAAMVLGYTRDVRANEGLRYALENGDLYTRLTAVELLSKGSDIERYNLLNNVAAKDRDEIVRLYAEYFLKKHALSELE